MLRVVVTRDVMSRVCRLCRLACRAHGDRDGKNGKRDGIVIRAEERREKAWRRTALSAQARRHAPCQRRDGHARPSANECCCGTRTAGIVSAAVTRLLMAAASFAALLSQNAYINAVRQRLPSRYVVMSLRGNSVDAGDAGVTGGSRMHHVSTNNVMKAQDNNARQ